MCQCPGHIEDSSYVVRLMLLVLIELQCLRDSHIGIGQVLHVCIRNVRPCAAGFGFDDMASKLA